MNIIESNLTKEGSSLCVELFSRKIKLPDFKIKDLLEKGVEEGKILLGIRAEEFNYDKESDIKVKFSNVEYMGSDTYGYTRTDRGETIVMRFDSKDPILVDKETVSYTHLTLPTTLHECRSRWSPYH